MKIDKIKSHEKMFKFNKTNLMNLNEKNFSKTGSDFIAIVQSNFIPAA